MSNMGKILYAEAQGVHVLKFIGEVRLTLGPAIASFLSQLKGAKNFKSVVIDLSETQCIDSTALGLLARIAICTRDSFGAMPSVISPREDITRILKSMAMEEVCLILKECVYPDNEMPAQTAELSSAPKAMLSEDALREQVLEAHKTLMSLNQENRDKFKDLVSALEQEKKPATDAYARTGCL